MSPSPGGGARSGHSDQDTLVGGGDQDKQKTLSIKGWEIFFIQNTIAERSEKIQDLTIENRENLGDQLVELVSRILRQL